jgi:sugar transferase (PEP-CTERM/EpsH1 system associated)
MRAGLKVVHIVLSLDVGGLERNVINQVREGRRLGQEVIVVCLVRPGTLAPQAQSLGARLFCLDKHPGLRLGLVPRLAALLRALHPDVVHTHQITSLIYAGPAAHAVGVPLVVHTEHGKERYAARLRTRLLGRLAGLFVSRFYCLSWDMADEILAWRVIPRRKIHVIGNGIEMERFHVRGDREAIRRSLAIPTDALVVGTVGRLTEVKRQHLLIQAVAQLTRRLPSLRLLLVGDGPLRNQLERLAQDLGVADLVHFAGYQPDPEQFYQAMDVFALTSQSEGIPQALIEAAASGLPAVASRVGGVPEVIEDGRSGLLFEPGDAAALLRGLETLLGDGVRGREIGEAARCRVESRFHVRRMAGDYHRHFLSLLRQAG